MSINTRLFVFCFAVGLMVLGLGWLAVGSIGSQPRIPASQFADTQAALDLTHVAQQRIARFDEGLRQGEPDPVLSPTETAALTATMRATTTDIAAVVAMSPSQDARRAAESLLALFVELDAAGGDVTRRLLLRKLEPVPESFVLTLEALRADTARLADEIDRQVEAYLWQSVAGLAALFSAFLILAIWMSRNLVGRLAEAGRIAARIAKGRFDAEIGRQGIADFERLFAALRDVQAGVAEYRRSHETRLMMQATSFDTTIETEHHRFVAAVNNMSQGLCMLDRDLNLIAFNEPFSAIFPHFEQGTTAKDVMSDPKFHVFLARHETGNFVHEMSCGRMLQVKRKGVKGGGLVMTFEDITDQYRISQKLEHLAAHDGLTNLPNRRAFRERLVEMLSDVARARPIAVFALDLNGFKAINDTFGHPLGDALLVAVGERLRNCVGSNDLLARLGGDEFALLQVEDVQPESAVRLADQIVAAFNTPFVVDGRPLKVGVGIGIALIDESARSGMTADILMQNCDLALYRAKAEGASAHRIYTAGMRDEIEARRAIDADLRKALDRRELELHYQPFVDADRRAVSGFEALLRWRHPERGMVSPARFVPIAEEIGLIDEIGLWALREACMAAAGWPAPLTVSVNLSPVQFRNPRLVEEVAAALDASGFDPARLQLEVTESLFLDNSGTVLETLTALRALGCLISMDDFGTGYSSLGYLARFPFDKIKIDQSFVRDIQKPESMAVIRAVIGLSRSMKLAVIAEGIETAEQYEMLHREGCREMQGYLFSKPRPLSDLPGIIINVPTRWDKTMGQGALRDSGRSQAA